MRIPPSVIVMSVVTAVPFGLAIRDTLAPVEHQLTYDPAQAVADDLRQLRLEAETSRTRAEQASLLAGLIGRERATPGPTLAGLTLGEPADRSAIEASEHLPFTRVAVMRDRDQRIVGLEVDLDRARCDSLHDQLVAAWGPGDVWIDRAHHRRASMTDCHFELDLYADPADWIALVHDELVGGSLDHALAVLGPASEVYEDDYSWWLPGLADGMGPTRLDVFAGDGKVRGMKLLATVPMTDVTAMIAALAAKLHGKPVAGDDDSIHRWSWSRRPEVQVQSNGVECLLMIGDAS